MESSMWVWREILLGCAPASASCIEKPRPPLGLCCCSCNCKARKEKNENEWTQWSRAFHLHPWTKISSSLRCSAVWDLRIWDLLSWVSFKYPLSDHWLMPVLFYIYYLSWVTVPFSLYFSKWKSFWASNRYSHSKQREKHDTIFTLPLHG